MSKVTAFEYNRLQAAHAASDASDRPEDDLNIERSQWAFAAVRTFASETGQRLPYETEETVRDLACDLLHFVEQHTRLTPAQVLYSAALNYAYETVSSRPTVAHQAARAVLDEASALCLRAGTQEQQREQTDEQTDEQAAREE